MLNKSLLLVSLCFFSLAFSYTDESKTVFHFRQIANVASRIDSHHTGDLREITEKFLKADLKILQCNSALAHELSEKYLKHLKLHDIGECAELKRRAEIDMCDEHLKHPLLELLVKINRNN